MSIINDNSKNGPYILAMIIVGALGFFTFWILQDKQQGLAGIPLANKFMVAKIVSGAICVLGLGWLLKRSL